MRHFIATILISLSAICAFAQRPFLDTSTPPDFLDLRAYGQMGLSGITQNYISSFPEINELNASMGYTAGVGAGATFNIRDFIGIGTQLNFLLNHSTLDLAVTGKEMSSVSSIFLKNHYYTVSAPVFVTLRFNIMRGLKWNIDLGAAYSYGIGGGQRQSIYDSRVNDIGQLVMKAETTRVGYYHDRASFINSYSRGDIAVHVATGLTFGRHVFMNIVSQIGLKNVSRSYGIVNPDIHNVNILLQGGYRF